MLNNLLNKANLILAQESVAEDKGGAAGFAESLSNFFTKDVIDMVQYLAIIAFVCIGICFIIPNEKCKQFAKDHILYVVVGVAIALSATSIANSLIDKF